MRTILFDIETGPLAKEDLASMMPTEWPLGNLKDPEKIKIAISAKEKAWLEDAALDALTGRVLAIGMVVENAFTVLSEPSSEATILSEFWMAIRNDDYDIHRIVGFNICLFDLPFLIKRSWKLGVEVPMLGLRDGPRWGKERVKDLREFWQLGDRHALGSLDAIAKHLGLGAKSGSGLDFAALWIVDKPKALEYLHNDLLLTEAIAKRIGVI
jgi:hypothetical protein